jgi:Arc/MetJ-type ribon-helix-helix transcriptional regulator
MSAVQIPNHLKQVIDRQVAEGRAASEADYVVDALHAYAEHIEAENEIAAMAVRADADMASGRFVTVTGPEDSEALHANTMARLRERMSREAEDH